MVIRVLADQYHYQLKQHLHPSVKLETYDPVSGWTNEQIRQADALTVRTVTPVNSRTVPSDHRLTFVATASAGRDHLDEEWLQENNIRFTDAKGSNARSVAEYVAVCVLISKLVPEDERRDLRAGIVGAGFTGSATARILDALGFDCVLYDPPLEEQSRTFRSASLDDVLDTDIISFHLPLHKTGRHATQHWYDSDKIRAYPKKLVINASRGGVVDESSLLKDVHEGHIENYICDVWEQEPFFNDQTAQNALLATPHIAGYSLEAKLNATIKVCDDLHSFFGIENPVRPEPETSFITYDDPDVSLEKVIRTVHPAGTYDSELRNLIGLADDKKRSLFHDIRQRTPLRNEFNHIALPEQLTDRYPALKKLGFLRASNK